MKQQKDSISSYGKFKLKDSLIRNILDHCLSEKKKSNELMFIYEKFKFKDSFARNM